MGAWRESTAHLVLAQEQALPVQRRQTGCTLQRARVTMRPGQGCGCGDAIVIAHKAKEGPLTLLADMALGPRALRSRCQTVSLGAPAGSFGSR